MDCNSYSYAPTLGSEHPDPISEYSNDDMTATLDYWKNQYNAHPQHPRINDYIVQASSYDGQLEVEEVFHKMESAFFLYTHIVTHYKSTPPRLPQIESDHQASAQERQRITAWGEESPHFNRKK